MSKKKKPFRAVVCLGKRSCLKVCDTLEQAREFLATKGGGVIEKRAFQMMYSSGHGFGYVEYDPPLKLVDWQFVERVSTNVQKPITRPAATHGFWIESDYPLLSNWLPKEAFTTIYLDRNMAVATAVEGVIDHTTEVRVVDLSTGKIIWNSMEEEFE